jgi:hypothetical protein
MTEKHEKRPKNQAKTPIFDDFGLFLVFLGVKNAYFSRDASLIFLRGVLPRAQLFRSKTPGRAKKAIFRKNRQKFIGQVKTPYAIQKTSKNEFLHTVTRNPSIRYRCRVRSSR